MTAQADPFSKWRMKETPSQSKSQPTTNSEDIFSKWRPQEKEEKGFLEELPRHAARTGSRIAETLLGLPGDVVKMVRILGESLPEEPEIFKREPSFVQKGTQSLLENLPGSQELKEFSEEKTSGFTKAKTPGEEISDEVFQDVTALMLPVKGKLPPFTKNIGTALAAQLGKQGIKMYGGSETTQDLTRAGLLFMGGLIRPTNALNYAEGLYKDAEALLPQGASVNAKKLEGSLESLVTSLEKGVETTDKKQVIKPANELLAKINNGTINVDELASAKRDINRLRGDPETVKGAKKLLSNIGKAVDNAIDVYQPHNPKYVKKIREANQAWGTIAESKKISNYIRNTLKNYPFKSTMGLLLESHVAGPETAMATIAGGAAIYGLVESGELLSRIMKSPVLRVHYADVLKAAMQENGPAVLKATKALDHKLAEEESNKVPFRKK